MTKCLKNLIVVSKYIHYAVLVVIFRHWKTSVRIHSTLGHLDENGMENRKKTTSMI